jgi:hypothetical protein
MTRISPTETGYPATVHSFVESLEGIAELVKTANDNGNLSLIDWDLLRSSIFSLVENVEVSLGFVDYDIKFPIDQTDQPDDEDDEPDFYDDEADA